MSSQAGAGKLVTPEIVVPLVGDTNLVVTFEYRPGIALLDMVADLGAFLVAIGELTDPAQAVNNAWDRGVITFDGGAPEFSENGIPDAMEFKLLETVLKDATLDLGFEGGVMNWHVYQDWLYNLAQARGDFATAPAAFQRAIAAYMTIGDYGLTRMVVEEVKNHLGLTFDAEPYSVKASRTLGYRGDADNDGISNLSEWQAADSIDMEHLFTAQALGKMPLPTPPDPDSGGSCTACPAAECAKRYSLTLKQPQALMRTEASSNDCSSPPIILSHFELSSSPSASSEVLEGSLVTVSTEAYGTFNHWDAPGLLIHGSHSPSETFVMPGGPITVESRISTPGMIWKFLDSTQIGQHIKLKISGEDAGVARKTDNKGNYIGVEVWAPWGAPVGVSYTYGGGFGLSTAGWKLHRSFSAETLVTFDTDIIIDSLHELEEIKPNLAVAGSMGPTVRHTVESIGGGTPHMKAGGGLSGATEIMGSLRLPALMQPNLSALPFYEWPKGTNYVKSEISVEGGALRVTHYLAESYILTLPETHCEGYATASEAKKYYQNKEDIGRGEVVEINAHSLPGYCFVGWEGDGACWLEPQNNPPESKPNVAISSTISNKIFVEMDDAKTVTAKFEEGYCGLEERPLIIATGGFSPSEIEETLKNWNKMMLEDSDGPWDRESAQGIEDKSVCAYYSIAAMHTDFPEQIKQDEAQHLLLWSERFADYTLDWDVYFVRDLQIGQNNACTGQPVKGLTIPATGKLATGNLDALVLGHELGHARGLGHPRELVPGSIPANCRPYHCDGQPIPCVTLGHGVNPKRNIMWYRIDEQTGEGFIHEEQPY